MYPGVASEVSKGYVQTQFFPQTFFRCKEGAGFKSASKFLLGWAKGEQVQRYRQINVLRGKNLTHLLINSLHGAAHCASFSKRKGNAPALHPTPQKFFFLGKSATTTYHWILWIWAFWAINKFFVIFFSVPADTQRWIEWSDKCPKCWNLVLRGQSKSHKFLKVAYLTKVIHNGGCRNGLCTK